MRKIRHAIAPVAALLVFSVLPAGAHPDEDHRIAEMREAFVQLGPGGQGGGVDGQSADHRPDRSRNLTSRGSNDFDGAGFNSDVWALGKHAYVGTWGLFTEEGMFCPNLGTKVVDISDPTSPDWVATLPAPARTQTNDVKVTSVNTPFFRGDLLVVSNEDCAPGGARGFELWDVTDPENASFLGRWGPEEAFDIPPDLVEWGFGVHNTFVWTSQGRAYVAAVVGFAEVFQFIFGGFEGVTTGDLRIVDVTDPTNPVQVADWGAIKDLGLDPFETGFGDDFALSLLHDVWVEKGVAYLSWWDAGLILLDASDPTNPEFISRLPYGEGEEGNGHVAVPSHGGNIVLFGDEDFTPGPWGRMHVIDTRDAANPVEIATFATDNALNAPPPVGDFSMHNVIVRGTSAYVSWYSDGVRLLDISRPASPREIGFFVPAAAPDPFGILPTAANVWGVYPHRNLVLASDMNSGLHVLTTRP